MAIRYVGLALAVPAAAGVAQEARPYAGQERRAIAALPDGRRLSTAGCGHDTAPYGGH